MAIWGMVGQFNWFDVAVVALVGLYAWQAWDRGLYVVVPEAISWVVGWMGGILVAQQWAGFLVTNFGLWAQSSWLWAFIMMVIVIEQLVYQSLKLALMKWRRQYFSRFWQLVTGLVPAALSGIMLIAFVTLVLIKIPAEYPLKQDMVNSWVGQTIMMVVGDVEGGR